MEECGLDSSGLEYGSAMGCFEHNNKSVDSIKKRECYQLSEGILAFQEGLCTHVYPL